MNIERLREVARVIQEKPFDMSMFNIDEECGTAHCIGGWAETIWPEHNRPLDSYPGEKSLELTSEEAHMLFLADKWPKKFLGEISSDDLFLGNWEKISPATAAARIEHFIATKGRE